MERTRDTEGIVALLERTVAQDPGHAEAQFLLGKKRFESGDFQEGQEAFEASVEQTRRFEEQIDFIREKHFRQRYDTGVEALAADRPERAIGALQDARVIKPDDYTVHRTLGHAFAEAERLEEALNAYQSALAHNSEDLETLANVGELEYRRGSYQAALQHATAGLEVLDGEVHPLAEDFLQRKANAHLRLGSLSEAETALNALLQLDGGSETRMDYARVLFNQEKYEEAHTQLLRIGADDEEYLRMLAESRYHMEDYDGMIETYERLLQGMSGDDEAIRNLIIGYEMIGDERRAASYREQLQTQLREGGSDD